MTSKTAKTKQKGRSKRRGYGETCLPDKNATEIERDGETKKKGKKGKE